MVSVAVIAAGSALTPDEVRLARDCDVVVAADRGFKNAVAAGCRVDRLVGDLDSLSEQGRIDAERRGLPVVEFPVDKDQSDLELALAEARAVPGVDVIHAFGIAGGRADHAALNLAVLTAAAPEPVAVIGHLGSARVHVVTRSLTIDEPVGTLVSLLAHGGAAIGVTTVGLRWSLDAATLAPDVSWGLSNEVVSRPATVRLDAGTLLVFVVIEPCPT